MSFCLILDSIDEQLIADPLTTPLRVSKGIFDWDEPPKHPQLA